MTDTKKIEELVTEELLAMCEKHKQEKFNSPHEAYAVTLEEVEEAEHEMHFVQAYTTGVKRDTFGDSDSSCNYLQLEKYALKAIQELIQVCACCQKAMRK